MASLIAAALACVLAQTLQPVPIGHGERTIAGRVVGLAGFPGGLSLHVHRPTPDGSVTTFAPIAPDGRFKVIGLAPGTYVLEAGPTPGGDVDPPASPERGFAAVRVGREDVADVAITLVRPATVRGRIRLDGGASPSPQPTGVTVLAQLAVGEWTSASESAAVAQDGTFALAVVGPRIFRAGWQGPDDGTQWWFESVQWKGRDVTNEPVDLTDEPAGELVLVFALRPTAIVGTVEDVAGIPMTNACVMMLSGNRDFHRSWSTAVGTATTDRRGRFHFTGMPPGEYQLQGLAQACPDRASLLSDGDVLMRRATAVTVVARRVARIIVTGDSPGSRP